MKTKKKSKNRKKGKVKVNEVELLKIEVAQSRQWLSNLTCQTNDICSKHNRLVWQFENHRHNSFW